MRADRLLLQDMLEAIAEVVETTPATQAAFDADKLVRSHVLRQSRSSAKRLGDSHHSSRTNTPRFLGG